MTHTNLNEEFGVEWIKEKRQSRLNRFYKIVLTIILILIASYWSIQLYTAYAEVNELRKTMTTKQLRQYLYWQNQMTHPENDYCRGCYK